MTITIPTLADLVQLNQKAMRRLEPLAEPEERRKEALVDSLGRAIDARPVDFPCYVTVTENEGNFFSGSRHDHQPIPERPYHWRRFNLTRPELQVVLGLDYIEGGPLTRGTPWEELNAMWLVNNHYPSRFPANAYVLGEVYHQSGSYDCIVPVQYYRIDARKHNDLGLPERELKEYLEKK